IKELAKRESRLSVNEIRVIVAIERAIARLSVTDGLTEHLVFKGGFVLLKGYGSPRFTRDVDALAIAVGKAQVAERVQIALTTDLDDGLWYGDV
ncbi:nucleotidyl transferase AbiEii/AbiGii toxin family protein, partial [Clostridium perfringens]|nr:nucleotidyl transferase AbiEii/AbiGii toxin family protein [Clostridium perfringens]